MNACVRGESSDTRPAEAGEFSPSCNSFNALGILETAIGSCEVFFAARLAEALERIRLLMMPDAASRLGPKIVRRDLSIAESNLWLSLRVLKRLDRLAGKKASAEATDAAPNSVTPSKNDVSPATWTSRLHFDAEISGSSPVVKGTWITAERILSFLVNGWTWTDILRDHPELTEDDIRACLSYAIEEENNAF